MSREYRKVSKILRFIMGELYFLFQIKYLVVSISYDYENILKKIEFTTNHRKAVYVCQERN